VQSTEEQQHLNMDTQPKKGMSRGQKKRARRRAKQAQNNSGVVQTNTALPITTKKKVKQKRDPSKPYNYRRKNPGWGALNPADPSQQTSVPFVLSQNILSNVQITVLPDIIQLSNWILGTISWFYERGVPDNLSSNQIVTPGNIPGLFIGAANYILQGQQNAMFGGVQMVTTIPKYINNLYKAVAPKSINWKCGKIAYAWNSTGLTLNIQSANSAPYGIFMIGQITDDGGYDDPIIPVGSFAPNVNDYVQLLKFFDEYTTNTKTVPIETKAITQRDASAFARRFVYTGTGITDTGGWYADVELEVPMNFPTLATFVPYGSTTDVRVARTIELQAGDSVWAMTRPLIPGFNPKTWKNKYPPVFKCIDINMIITWLSNWAAAVKTCACAKENINSMLINSFSFTQQDFSILVRQALMSVFPTQKAVQFLAPIEFSQTGTNNGFVALMAASGTYGNDTFQKMQIPQFLQEQINGLKMRLVRPDVAHKAAKNVVEYVPVLGVYVTDVPLLFTFENGDLVVPLFAEVPQDIIYLPDGSAGGDFYNLNSSWYSVEVMGEWNAFVSAATEFTSQVTNIGGDGGLKTLPLIAFTNYVDSQVLGKRAKAIRKRNWDKRFRCYSKREPIVVEKPVSKKNVKENLKETRKSRKIVDSDEELPPRVDIRNKQQVNDELDYPKSLPSADYTDLIYSRMTTSIPMSDELASLMDKLILPSIRLDPNNAKGPLNLQMNQVINLEPYTKSYAVNTTDSVAGYTVAASLYDGASVCVTGTAAAQNQQYTDLFRKFAAMGIGGGLIGSLAGGLFNAIGMPDVAGLANLVPF